MYCFDKKLPKSPELTANPISKLFLLWILPLLRKGRKKDLNLKDLYQQLPQDSSSHLGKVFQTEWNRQLENSKRPPKLWMVVRNFVWKPYLLVFVLFTITELMLRPLQPLFLKRLIRSFITSPDDHRDATGAIVKSTEDTRHGQLIYASLLVLVTFTTSVLYQHLTLLATHLGMRCRVGLSVLIFNKLLKVSQSQREESHLGKLCNLLTRDVSQFLDCHLYPAFFISPIQFAIYMYMLWVELGWATCGGLASIFLLLPLLVYSGRFSMYFRTRISRRTDDRGRFLSEIIQGIRLVKMYTWEKPLSLIMRKLRTTELKYIRRFLYLKGTYLTLQTTSIKFVPFCALLAYVTMGNALTADKAFFVITILNTLSVTVLHRIPAAASTLGELIASLNRIEGFLLASEQRPHKVIRSDTYDNGHIKGHVSTPGIIMKNYSGKFAEEGTCALNNLTVSLTGNKLVMIVGHVGCGKTSFLNAILAELPFASGKCLVQGRLSYAAQEAWIFPATLRENILFGLPINKEKYSKVIHLSCLMYDLKQLPDGDLTLVGERGISLSGGQKARLNLARALYQESDIYLFDDPLSSVDTKVGQHLFHRLIKEHLDGKLRILVSHQLHFLPMADHIIVLNRNGEVWAQGTYKEIIHCGVDLSTLISENNSNCLPDINPDTDKPDITHGQPQIEVEEENEEFSTTKLLHVANSDSKKVNGETKLSGSVGVGTYLRFLKLGGSSLTVVFIALWFLTTKILFSGLDFWLSVWTNSITSAAQNIPNQNYYVYIYCGMLVGFILSNVIRFIFFFRYCMKISVNIHDVMLKSVVAAPLTFFDVTTSGTIMNRFTKDLNQTDENLHIAIFEFCDIFLTVIGTIVLNLIANQYSAIPAVILIWSLRVLREFYLSTARDLQRIEAVNKSPVFTHVTMVAQGLTTIRASQAEGRVLAQFHNIQDTHTSVAYLAVVTSRWFVLVLETINCGFLAFVAFGFVLVTTSNEGGHVGVAVTSVLGLYGALQWGIMQSAQVENQMTSVERIFEYCNLRQEDQNSRVTLHESWPREGKINFNRVSLGYDKRKKNRALKSVTFSIASGEKVGVVGRTGAGKSSVIAAIFRLYAIQEGEITVDGIPIQDVELNRLRSKISIIPQDPFLFAGSIRYNLDPFQEFSDAQVHQVLKEVDLHEVVEDLTYRVADGGSNFSVGQRQLICLARALLRKNKIIIVDEATANVDPVTDHLVQLAIRGKFSNCTILTIAHRLQSVLDNDKIMIMQDGEIVEFASPKTLIANAHSVFSSMLRLEDELNKNPEVKIMPT